MSRNTTATLINLKFARGFTQHFLQYQLGRAVRLIIATWAALILWSARKTTETQVNLPGLYLRLVSRWSTAAWTTTTEAHLYWNWPQVGQENDRSPQYVGGIAAILHSTLTQVCQEDVRNAHYGDGNTSTL